MKADGNAYENTIETRRTRRKRRRHAKGMHKDTYGGKKKAKGTLLSDFRNLADHGR